MRTRSPIFSVRTSGNDSFDDANGLVSHAASGIALLHGLVRLEIAAADAGAANGHDRIGRFDNAGVGNVLDSNVAGESGSPKSRRSGLRNAEFSA